MHNKVKFTITTDFCIFVVLMLFLLPLRWLLGWLIATFLHELFHYVVLKLSGIDVFSLKITAGGVIMESEPVIGLKGVFCSLSGPIGGLSLLLLRRWMPCTAVCAWIHSVYNLLPIYPLDGGRALACFLELVFSDSTSRMISACVGCICFVCLITLGILSIFQYRLGPIPVLFAVMLIIKNLKLNIPCKQEKQIVQ